MGPADVIRAQLEVLGQELWAASNAVESPAVDAPLRARVAARFDLELTRLKNQHTALKTKVASGQALDACWRELRRLQADCGKIFDECLALIQGSLARKAGLDDGICALTDDLLDDLAAWSDVPWGRFTLLATSEFYRDTAEIIRVRYPEASLWSLPLAAHEFGHYLGPELRQKNDGAYVYPFQAQLKAADENRPPNWQLPHTQQWHHLQEYFADLFATYTLGPAYAAAFILLRMNPTDADQNTLTHPAGVRRVHGILWALDKLDEQQATPFQHPFREVTAYLRKLWQDSQPASLTDAEAALATQTMAALWELLVGATPSRLALDRAAWQRSEGLAANLAPAALPPGLTRRDVVNAAWLARLQSTDPSPHAVGDIARAALAVYRRIPPPA